LHLAPQNQAPTPQSQLFNQQQTNTPGFFQWQRANQGNLQGQNANQQFNLYQGAVNSPGGHAYGTQVPLTVNSAPQATQPTPTPTQLPQQPVVNQGQQRPTNSMQPNITIPYSQGGKLTLPPAVAQILLNAFNSTGQATNAAQVLNHPKSQTYTPSEVQQFGHTSNNYGENASFKYVGDSTNSDGSTDRGLFRINSNTFNGYMSNPTSRQQLAQMGITSYDDMNDPQKNANFASLLQQNSGWGRWFAAPLSLKNQGNNLAQQ
jgi:hypothetical protein